MIRNCQWNCLLQQIYLTIVSSALLQKALIVNKIFDGVLIVFLPSSLLDQAKIELITTFLGRNYRMDFMKGACLSANIMYVAGAFRRNRGSKKYIQGVKNGNS